MRFTRRSGRLVAIAAVPVLALTLAGCGSEPQTVAKAGMSAKVSMLIVRSNNIRYVSQDPTYFSQRLLDLCPDCTVDVQYAEQDEKKQAEQVTAALDGGAKVLVLNAVVAANAGPLATAAKQRGVPVISYDRLVQGAPIDYHVAFDNIKAGQLQGKALLEAAQARGGGELIWIDGPATDTNGIEFSKGAASVIGDKLPIAARFQMQGGWKFDQVTAWAKQTLPTLKGRKIVGVYAPTDPTASAIVPELIANGFSPLPAVTGQDSDFYGLQRVMTDQQTMTLYKPFRKEAEKAADLAFALLKGERPKADTTVDNKAGQMPAFLLEPVVVTKDTLKSTVFADGFVTATALCAGQYAAACRSLGIG